MKTWFTIMEVKENEQTVVFDGVCREYFATGLAQAANQLTGNRIVVTKGKELGKFVAELPARS